MNKEKTIYTIILFLFIFLVASFFGYYVGNKNASKDEDKKIVEPKKTKEEKDEEKYFGISGILSVNTDISGANINDVLTKIGIRARESDSIFGYFEYEKLPKGNLDYISKKDKRFIIYYYAVNNKLYYKINNNAKYCNDSYEYCYGITKRFYSIAAENYNISDDFEELYSGYYIFRQDQNSEPIAVYDYDEFDKPYRYKHTKIEILKEGNLIVRDTVDVYEIRDETTPIATLNIEYKFYILRDGSYALYSIDY